MSSRHKKTGSVRVPTRDPDSEFEGQEMDSVEMQSDEEEILKTSDNASYIKLPNLSSVKQNASEFIVGHLEKNTKLIIFPAFAITAAVCAIAVVIGFFGFIPRLFGLIVIDILTIITAFIAMWGIYKWGQIDDHIDFYQEQNTQYCNHTNELKETQIKLKKEVDQMQEQVHNLKNETMELNQCIESFEELHDALKEVLGDDEHVLSLIDQLNQQYNDMKILYNHKEKAELLLGYYRVQFGGQSKGTFDENDYERFLGRLNKTTRGMYEVLGGFQAMDINRDGNVDANEFVRLTDKVLQDTDSAFVEFAQKVSERK